MIDGNCGARAEKAQPTAAEGKITETSLRKRREL